MLNAILKSFLGLFQGLRNLREEKVKNVSDEGWSLLGTLDARWGGLPDLKASHRTEGEVTTHYTIRAVKHWETGFNPF